MSYTSQIYDKFVVDVAAGLLTNATTVNALLLKSAYSFSRTDANVAAVSGNETTGAGYARSTAASKFTVAQVGDEVQYQTLSPAVNFSAFTTTDWRYIVIYNASSTNLYLCLDSGVTNTSTSAPLTLSFGTDPAVRMLAA